MLSALGALGGALGRGAMRVRELLENVLLLTPLNLGYAAALAVLAGATARRKRVAYWVLIAYFSFLFLVVLLVMGIAISGVADEPGKPYLNRGDTIGLALAGLVSIGALNLLFWGRHEFYARVRKGGLRQAFKVFAGVVAIGIGLGYTLVSVFPGSLEGAAEKLRYSVDKVLGGFGFALDTQGAAPGWVNFILGLFGAVAVFAGLFTLLRSQQVTSELSGEEESRIRGLLDRYGEQDSLGYFATRRDKAAVFSPNGKAAITYRVVNGVSLASGDPVGDPQAWDPAIAAWIEHARRYAWVPAVMGASEEGATAYDRAAMKVIHLGDEAVLDAKEFTLEGRDMRPVRQAVNRVERAGYTATVRRHADIAPPELKEAADLATRWRDTESERGFSMALGRLGDPNDGACVLVSVQDGTGATKALLSFSPWGKRGLSLDLMRRDPQAENGVMEFMVSELMRQAPGLGVDRVSLNFAVFRSVFSEGGRIGAGPILRLARRLLLFFSKWWQLESLYRANAKYHPQWEPRFLCIGERRELARVGIASGIAEGFLTLPGTHAAPLDHSYAPLLPATEILPSPEEEQEKVPEQMGVRMEKLDHLRAAGYEPYPVTFARNSTCAQITRHHRELPPDQHTGDHVSLAGRIMLLRNHGRVCFATLRDWSGDLQLMLESDLERWKSTVDIGDHVGISGEVVTSRRGELTVLVSSWTLTAKCLRPLPDKHAGLSDPEARVRQRYLDLIVNPSSRDTLRTRSLTIRSLRESLAERGFIEVETPILQRIHGGANAKPFTTHINAYDMRLYLRIAPELYLKRLCVGGVEKVFELGRTFRNEGVDFKHNPEFTMLEAYQAYADYNTMRELTQSLVQALPVARDDLDLSGQWPVVTVNDAISHALGEQVTADTTREELVRLCERAGVPVDPGWGAGAVVLEMYERLVESKTVQPTFYKDFPAEVSPLTRSHRDDPRLAERWDLVAFGSELGTAYSELIDPVEQRRRLTEQSLLAAGGDPEAMELDLDFLEALEHAMPPSGGLGIGVDRLVMLLTGKSIRETLAFPLVRRTVGQNNLG
ncbi:lysine--tRNA ligase [Rhizocola hellebori]|uniref:Lysine--tRNA ligase n=1 Tax=Rhizocola hellebori TaxID=1392758 RepID=A0A8J3VKU0_9ACTN|nr:lysine--tRNA ligase [Rhizocola hellebori]